MKIAEGSDDIMTHKLAWNASPREQSSAAIVFLVHFLAALPGRDSGRVATVETGFDRSRSRHRKLTWYPSRIAMEEVLKNALADFASDRDRRLLFWPFTDEKFPGGPDLVQMRDPIGGSARITIEAEEPDRQPVWTLEWIVEAI